MQYKKARIPGLFVILENPERRGHTHDRAYFLVHSVMSVLISKILF